MTVPPASGDGPDGLAAPSIVSASLSASCVSDPSSIRSSGPSTVERQNRNPASSRIAIPPAAHARYLGGTLLGDRKSTRLNSSHVKISYAVFCLKKKIKV